MEDSNRLLSVQEARQTILAGFVPLATEIVRLEDSLDRVLSQSLRSPLELPPFSNSSVDGFAARAEDIRLTSQANPTQLAVIGDIPAGTVPQVHLEANQAARIMTGAQLPGGADCVIPVEETDFNYRQAGIPAPSRVKIMAPIGQGENIRPAGQDIHRGDEVFAAGHRLRPMDLGMLSILGQAEVPVYCKPRVAIFSSGDELLPVEAELTPGKIHDANTYSVSALTRQFGGIPIPYGIVPDREDQVAASLNRAVDDRVDIIVSSAGVSVGALDFMRLAVEKHGRLDLWRVNMRPGKPFAFGSYQEIPFFGLPGNPVSAYVTYLIFGVPVLLRLQGVLDRTPSLTLPVTLDDPVSSDGRESYLRASISRRGGEYYARLSGHQGSGNMLSLVQANALLIIPSGVKSLPVGSRVEAWLINEQNW